MEFEVRGYDVRPQAAEDLADVLQASASPAELGRDTDVILVAVLNDEQIRHVLVGPEGLLTDATRAKVVIILSTATLTTVRWAAAECERHGINLMDCGVSGGAGGLEARAITAMVGGDADAFELARPVLEAFANPVLHMGALGRGMAAKLARNVLVYTDWSVAWEAARLAQAAGVDIEKFVEAVEASDRYVGGHTSLIRDGLGLGDSAPDVKARGASVAVYANKDLKAALELGAELDLDMPAAELALSRVAEFTEDEARASRA
jgi:3-hydroxyisobutyrate dehydrogenase-like beta-hydroxyacid dehydrogenase